MHIMRLTIVILALIAAYIVLAEESKADLEYWEPTDIDLMEVARATVQVPAACEGAQYRNVKDFISGSYFEYPETNFQAKFLPGPPKLKFFSQTGLLREINIARFSVVHIDEILRRWGFKKDSKRAFDIRTEIFNSGTLSVVKDELPPLQLDENGNIVLPDWAREREAKIASGEIDPNVFVDPTSSQDAEQTRRDAEKYLAGISGLGDDVDPDHFQTTAETQGVAHESKQ